MSKVRGTALLLFFFFAALVPAAVGCADASDADPIVEGDEAALTEAQVLAKGVAVPSGIGVVSGFVYFGSGEKFGYWNRKFFRVPITGGRVQTVSDSGPITAVRVAGTKVLYAMDVGCWISSVDASQTGEGTKVYSDADCEPDSGNSLRGFEVTADGKLVVVRQGGDVLKGSLDGAGMRKIGEVRAGNARHAVRAHALAGGDLYIVTQRGNFNGPHELYKVSLDSGSTTKVLDFVWPPTHFVSDGTNLYFTENPVTEDITEDDTKVNVIKPGASAPEKVAEGFRRVTDLAADGKNVYVADNKRGAIYVVFDPLTSPRKKKLAVAKGMYSMFVSGPTIYFGTNVLGNDEAKGLYAAGIIGSVAIPAP